MPLDLLIFLAVEHDGPLIHQTDERLIEVHEAEVAHGLDEKAGVQQVHDSVLDAARVLIYRVPLSGGDRVERPIVVAWTGVPQEVPRGVNESVHRVRLALGRATALRAGRVDEVAVPCEW